MSEASSQSTAPNQTQSEHWRVLAEQASTEPDPQRLLELISDLCMELDKTDALQRNWLQTRAQHESIPSFLDSVISATKADFGNIQLLDTSNGTLKIVAARGFDSDFLHFFERVKPSEGCACSVAMKNGSRVIAGDVELDPLFSADARTALRKSRVRSLQSTPLLIPSGRLIGVVSTHYMEANGPNDEMWSAVDHLAAEFVKEIA